MGGSRWRRRASPGRFIRPAALLFMMLLLKRAGYRPPGDAAGDVFLVRCPHCDDEYAVPMGSVTCAGCGNGYIVARCINCDRPDAVAVGRPHPEHQRFESWHCATCGWWDFAFLCPHPRCRTLASSLEDGTWQCAREHRAFTVGRCGECGWFAGTDGGGYLRCEWDGRHATALES